MCCNDSEELCLRAPPVTMCITLVYILCRSGDNEGLHCVQCHPTHPHLVVTGRTDGSVCFWDLRHQRQPLSHMEAHTDIGVCLCVYVLCVCLCVCVCMYCVCVS